MFSKFREDKYDVIFLQDVHWDKSTVDIVKEEWGYISIASPYTTQARGTAILIDNTFEFTLGEQRLSEIGNYTLVELNLPTGLSIVLGSIYGPNQDTPEFYKDLGKLIDNFENPSIILGGDWNSTRDFSIDNKNYKAINNPKITKEIDNLCAVYNLVDPWRINNPNRKRYTWLQGVSNKQARLDYFLCTEELMSITKNYKINTKYRSDHAPIAMTLELTKEKRGPGTWKFNNKLLLEDDFNKMIKKEINIIKSIYAATPYNPDYIETISHGFDIMIGAPLFWETILVTLRGKIITYAAKRKRNQNLAKKKLVEDIETLDAKINTGNGSPTEMNKLHELNENLIRIRKEELNGALIRSRANWLEYGERPSKFFLNLENKNKVNKNISEIKLEDGTTLDSQQDILNELADFYEGLYKEKPTTDEKEIPYEVNKLTPTEFETLENEITKQELDKALSMLKNNKSPGIDGYSPEFLKHFWTILGDFFHESIKESFELGKLTNTQSQGLITCLPKSGKSRNLIKNWRPISLLNTTYKLISLCITNRLRKVLNTLISPEQKGFLEGRSISDCTRLMYDIIYECQVQNKPGLILLVDFEKAFDSLSWSFIHKSLVKFGFGPKFRKWIHMFQQNSNSRVILNGNMSRPFKLHRGCRQGDPISPYLFILASEFLTQAFVKDPEFKGITVQKKEHKISQYADDTSAFMEASEKNLRKGLEILEWFYQQSGLKINYSKTKVIKIGSERESDRRFCRENCLDWVKTFTALGINYDIMDIENITNMNINEKIESMKNILQAWGSRKITPIGKITIAKSLVMSKITHILQSLPSPDTPILKTLDDMFYNFIWGKKRHEVSKQTICKEIKDGGLKMLNTKDFDTSLKITWFRKILRSNPDWLEFAEKYKIDRLVLTDEQYHKEIVNNIDNPFWKNVAQAFIRWYRILKQHIPIKIEDKPIWGNPKLNIPFNIKWFRYHIVYIEDMFTIEGNKLQIDTMKQTFGNNIMFTECMAFWKNLPKDWIRYMTEHRRDYNVKLHPVIEWLLKDQKGGTNIRKILSLENLSKPPITQESWAVETDTLQLDWPFFYKLPFSCKLNARTKYFQFQVLHRSLITNKKLKQFRIKESDACDFCEKTETISHALYDCPSVCKIWTDVQHWFSRYVTSQIYLDKISILFGNDKNKKIINTLILIVKHEIYKKRCKNKRPTLKELKETIKYQMNIEIYLGTINNQKEKVLGKWAAFYNDLKKK